MIITHALPELFQNDMNQPYAPDLSDPVVPPLMTSVLYHCMWSRGEELGRHHHVLFKDIYVYLEEANITVGPYADGITIR